MGTKALLGERHWASLSATPRCAQRTAHH